MLKKLLLGLFFTLFLFQLMAGGRGGSTLPPSSHLNRPDWDMSFNNGAHDPVLIFSEGKWYMFYTSFGLRFKSSEDGLNWTDEKAVFKGRPEWAGDYLSSAPSINIWAPDIFYYRGIYYLTYSISSFGKNSSVIGLASNTTLDPSEPEYNWEDHGAIFSSDQEDSFNAIDSELFLYEGAPWLIFGSWWSGIKMTELDRETLLPLNPDHLIDLASRPEIDAVEGATLFTHENDYYLLLSFDHCCRGIQSDYNLVVGRAETPEGPYYDREGTPLLEGGGTLLIQGGDRWKGPGHGDVYQTVKGDILFFHSYDSEKNGEAYLRAGKIDWDDEGWPSVSMEMDR